jgi:hypothetical protein
VRREKRITLILLSALVMVLLVAVSSVAAAQTATVDFQSLPEGKIVYTLSAGNGISGDPISGEIAVWGHNPLRAWNTAVIFDGACDGGCTGGDDDLYFPEQGNILIVDERGYDGDGDGIVDTPPNDADEVGAYLSFDFQNYGPGVVRRQPHRDGH